MTTPRLLIVTLVAGLLIPACKGGGIGYQETISLGGATLEAPSAELPPLAAPTKAVIGQCHRAAEQLPGDTLIGFCATREAWQAFAEKLDTFTSDGDTSTTAGLLISLFRSSLEQMKANFAQLPEAAKEIAIGLSITAIDANKPLAGDNVNLGLVFILAGEGLDAVEASADALLQLVPAQHATVKSVGTAVHKQVGAAEVFTRTITLTPTLAGADDVPSLLATLPSTIHVVAHQATEDVVAVHLTTQEPEAYFAKVQTAEGKMSADAQKFYKDMSGRGDWMAIAQLGKAPQIVIDYIDKLLEDLPWDAKNLLAGVSFLQDDTIIGGAVRLVHEKEDLLFASVNAVRKQFDQLLEEITKLLQDDDEESH